MSRMIDADKLAEWFSKYFEEDEKVDNREIHEVIDSAPTVEALPVVHGHWMWFEEISPSNTDHYEEIEDCGWKCSCCNRTLEEIVGGYWDDIDDAPKLNYCPNCGAKMDGERKENG